MKRFISILLALLLVLAVAVISAGAYYGYNDYSKMISDGEYNPSDSYTVDENTPYTEDAILNCVGSLSNTQKIYFQAPEDWANNIYNNFAGPDDSEPYMHVCIYWWTGDACSWPDAGSVKWVGYQAHLIDKENRIYQAYVPLNTTKICWNNGVNGGMDSNTEIFYCARNLNDADIEGAASNEYDTLPEGTPNYNGNMDGCISIIDYSQETINPLTGFSQYGSNWYVYYGEGCYGKYPVTSRNYHGQTQSCCNPEHHHINYDETTAPEPTEMPTTEPVPETTPSYYYCDHWDTYTVDENYRYYNDGTYSYDSLTYCSYCHELLYSTRVTGGTSNAARAKCINFDNSTTRWEGPVQFYVYDPDAWEEIIPWGSKRLNGVDNGDGTWSYDPSTYMDLQPGKQYCIIFTDRSYGGQTYDLLFDTSCLGDTAYTTGNSIENPVDSNKVAIEARWKNSSLGPRKQITSIGNVVGETIPAFTTPYKMFVDFLRNTLDQARTYSGKNDQRLIDDTAKALGLGKSDVERAIREAGAWVDWDASRSTLSGGSSSYPKVTAEPDVDGIEISWTNTGANWYRVYYYGRNGWTRLADVRGTSYVDTDVRSGGSYTYTVRALSNDRSSFTSDYDHNGVVGTYYTAPNFTVSNAEDGVRISWSAVSGVPKYRVYYRGANGWVKLTDTSSTSFVDTDVRSGGSYTYTVRALNAGATEFLSGFRTGRSIRFLTAPKFSLSNAEDGIRISWPSVTGAAKYRIYYYGSSGWRRMVDTYDTSYVDTDVRSGNSYTYTVRCITADGSDVTSDYRAGKSIRFLTAPKFSLSNAEDGIRISWPSVTGAAKYRIYYYGSSGWRRMVDTASTSYVDTDVRSGNSYTYTVRCITADGGEVTSDYRAGKSIRFVMAPVFSLSNASNGVRISWPAVPGAAKYRVYYRSRNGWTKLTDTASTSVIDTDVRSGASYTYTVRCIAADGSSFTSDFRAGKSITYTPVR